MSTDKVWADFMLKVNDAVGARKFWEPSPDVLVANPAYLRAVGVPDDSIVGGMLVMSDVNAPGEDVHVLKYAVAAPKARKYPDACPCGIKSIDCDYHRDA